jgi:hypothetical protein
MENRDDGFLQVSANERRSRLRKHDHRGVGVEFDERGSGRSASRRDTPQPFRSFVLRGDYLLALKANRSLLRQDAAAFFDEPRFAHLAMMVESRIERNGALVRERGYYGSSTKLDAKTFAVAVRAHWGVENRLHWAPRIDATDCAPHLLGCAAFPRAMGGE